MSEKLYLLYETPEKLLQKLIQFNTTNPPGNERDCIFFIKEILSSAGIPSGIYAKDPARPNLVARIKGEGKAPPFLMYGHVDVVTTEGQDWTHPPFEGRIVDGFVWGRGALDMKGGVAMMISAFLRAKVEGLKPAGDVILAVLSDEEAGGDYGAKFLTEEHPELFSGVRYAIGEFGGFTLHLGKKWIYPIQVSEKQICWLRAIFRGEGGHGSMPVRGQAMARLARFLLSLDRKHTPVHITPVARAMVKGFASSLGGLKGAILRLMSCPAFTNKIISLLGDKGRIFYPIFHNTASPTILHGSSKINVIPGKVILELDGRLLPGFSPQDLIKELKDLAGEDVEIELVRFDPGPSEVDLGLWNTLEDTLREMDPEAKAVQFITTGVTDARFFARLGIQTYGFTPMKLPPDFNFVNTIHGPNERIPVEAVYFGAETIFRLLGKLGQAN